MSGIYITPLERIRKLQAENARLRALVGEPAPVEDVESEMGEQAEITPTIIGRVGTVEETIDVLFGGAE
jgi:hypothetical protein